MTVSAISRITVVVDHFPAETFVLRQVVALDAEVATGIINHEAIRRAALATGVVSLTGGKDFKGGRLYRAVQRLMGRKVPTWSRAAERAWREYLLIRKPPVVLAQFGPNGLRCLQGCRETSVPLVVHFHGYDASSLPRSRAYRLALPALFDYAAHVIAVSQAMRQSLINLGCPEKKLHVIPCGVPVAEFSLSQNSVRQPCQFLAVGRFVPKKSPLELLRAFRHCVGQCPDTRLTMVGDGPLWQQARQWVKRNALEERVELTGPLAGGAVAKYMSQAGCFVQHSVTAPDGDMEGWPVAIAEAASSGLPVIATRHAGIPEEVIDGQTGYLVAEGHWQAMGDRMIELARNPQLRLQMGQAGRTHIAAVGDFNQQVNRLRDVLISVCPPGEPRHE